MNTKSILPYRSAMAAPILLSALLPAQGYIAMTATQIPQTNAPAGVADAGIAARADGSWVVFGGEQANGLLAGTFVVNNNVWQQRVSVLNPAQRTGHQLAFDGARGDSVMFGGKDVLGNVLSDTWVFANDQWSYRPTPSPSARSGHRMCFDAARGVVVLFGGKDAAQALLGDTWTWNGTAWAQAATAVAPVARHEHGVAYDAYRQKVVLFGGEAASGLRSDVWDWDGASWVEVVPPLVSGVAFGPVARKQHAMGFDAVAERVVVFGGDRGGAGVGSDSWAFDGANWVGLFPGGSQPSARAKCVLASAASGRLRVFGGVSASTYANDVWEPNVPVLPRAFEYEAPCIGSGGPLELRLTAGTQATIGTTLGMRMTGMTLSFAVGFGFAGFSRTSVSGIPLPVDLALVGIPGCNAYNSADINFSLGLPSGTPLATAWNLAIPNDSYFLGLDLYLQALALEGFGYPRFATVTNGVGIRIGNPVTLTPPGPPPSFNMVAIPGGTFQMGSFVGSNNEQPVHGVTLTRPFWVGRYEVTQAEYQAVMGNNPSRFQFSSPQRPVEQVSWNDAMAYCAALTGTEVAAGRIPAGYQYRLPTEAEWEYCCRSGTSTDYCFGANLTCGMANIFDRQTLFSCYVVTLPVGSLPVNPWGLFDVHGNVWEWCLDAWDNSFNYPSSTVADPYVSSGPYRVYRGGSYQDSDTTCRSATRFSNAPSFVSDTVGFRVVLAPVRVP
jgi:formylglycine-generating enzyme required for sulfatase activity